MVERRSEYKSGKIISEKCYFISSLEHTNPKKIGVAARLHWGIENKLHLILDAIFKEDNCRIIDEIAALNFTGFRKMELSLLKLVEPFGKKVNSIKKATKFGYT